MTTDSGYICSICCQDIEEQVLVVNEKKYKFYHKGCVE